MSPCQPYEIELTFGEVSSASRRAVLQSCRISIRVSNMTKMFVRVGTKFAERDRDGRIPAEAHWAPEHTHTHTHTQHAHTRTHTHTHSTRNSRTQEAQTLLERTSPLDQVGAKVAALLLPELCLDAWRNTHDVLDVEVGFDAFLRTVWITAELGHNGVGGWCGWHKFLERKRPWEGERGAAERKFNPS